MELLFVALMRDDIGQELLVPRRVTEFLPRNHNCFFVQKMVDKMDFDGVEEIYMDTPGKPAYSRRMLLRLVIFAYIYDIFSSRKISLLCRENLAFMYITGNKTPSFTTICRFKQDNDELIREAFKLTVKVAKDLDLVELEHIAIDGTKIKANASKSHITDEKHIQKVEEIIKKGIDVDVKENVLYGEENLDDLSHEEITGKMVEKQIEKIKKEEKKLKKEERLHKAEHQIIRQGLKSENGKKHALKKLEHAKEELKKTDQNTVSLSDPESKWMMGKDDKQDLNYNLQNTVDHKSGIVVATDVTQDPTDHYQFIPQIEQVTKNYGQIPDSTSVSNDNGYFTEENIKYAYDNNIDLYTPNRQQAVLEKNGNKAVKPFHKYNFKYVYEWDCYICPNYKILPYQKTTKHKGKPRYLYYTDECQYCPYQLQCAKKQRKRTIVDTTGPYGKKMAYKMESETAQLEYAKRKEAGEWSFGNTKHNRKYIKFTTRGLNGVKTENYLLNTSQNLKKIQTLLKNQKIEETNT